MSKPEAIEATVTGQDQQVGFRAMVMKQAIEYNLAGIAQNEPNQIVRFTLQGDKHRIQSALAVIKEGTTRSADIAVTTAPITINPNLKAFTIVEWSSSSRDITDKYDLVFNLRDDNSILSQADVKSAWHHILHHTLNADDLKKLGPSG